MAKAGELSWRRRLAWRAVKAGAVDRRTTGRRAAGAWTARTTIARRLNEPGAAVLARWSRAPAAPWSGGFGWRMESRSS